MVEQEDNIRYVTLLERIALAEAKLEDVTYDPIKKVKDDLIKKKLQYVSKFVKVPQDYYNRTISERAVILKANVEQLCKSLIFENTYCDHNSCDDITNSRYYLVVVQYAAKIDSKILENFVHSLRNPEDRLARKKFHFQLAPEEISDKMSGFKHNAVTPFGMNSFIPVIICENCTKMNPSFIYLGGGKVDIKLAMPIRDFIKSTNAIVGLISNSRTFGSNEEDD